MTTAITLLHHYAKVNKELQDTVHMFALERDTNSTALPLVTWCEVLDEIREERKAIRSWINDYIQLEMQR